MKVQPDVVMDQASAVAAVERVRGVAEALEHATGRRQALAEVARTDWEGSLRDDFDTDLDPQIRQSRALGEDLRWIARRIEDAIVEAATEQRHRERIRLEEHDARERGTFR